MNKVLDTIIGDLGEKRRWRETQKRAKNLPGNYKLAYFEIQKYLWATSGIETIKPFENLLDLFETGVAEGREVLEITGENVAKFADELVFGERGYFEKRRQKLNETLKKLRK